MFGECIFLEVASGIYYSLGTAYQSKGKGTCRKQSPNWYIFDSHNDAVHVYYISYQMSFIIGNRICAAVRAWETKQLLHNHYICGTCAQQLGQM